MADTRISSDTDSDHRHTLRRNRGGLLLPATIAWGALSLAGCGVGGQSVDAAPDRTDCPAWVDQVVTSTPVEHDVDSDAWRQHFVDRSAVLDGIAAELPEVESAVLESYADAMRAFGDDPLAPGASRRLGEAAADAGAIASRAC